MTKDREIDKECYPAKPNEQEAALVDDLDRVLDFESDYSAIVHDLADELNIKTGLTAILNPAGTDTSAPLAASSTPVTQDTAISDTYVTRFASFLSLSSLTPQNRLNLRTDPGYPELRETIKLVRDHINDLNRNLTRIPNLDRARVHALTHALDRDLASDLLRYLDSALDRAEKLAGDLDRAHARDRDRDHAFTGTLARDRNRDREHARIHAHELINALGRARDLTHDLTRDRHLARIHALIRVHALVRDLDLDLVRDLTHARVRAHTHTRTRIQTLVRKLGLDLDLTSSAIPTDTENLELLLTTLESATRDFTKTDLREVSLKGIFLEGIQWSSETRWPPAYEERIREESDKNDDDTFVIQRSRSMLRTKTDNRTRWKWFGEFLPIGRRGT